MNVPRHPLATAALAPLSWLYRAAVGLRNGYYDTPGRSHRAALPVISVGNLTTGGTGKTPLVVWLARRLTAEGLRPAVVSRGYGGQAGRGPLSVSDGTRVLAAAADCGDEPFLLAGLLPGVPVVVGSDRLAGCEAARHAGAQVALLDDGFQHRRLARDLDIVLLDSGRPFGGGRLLPAGHLREPVAGLARADAVLITRADAGDAFPAIEREVRRHNASAPILRAGHRPVGFRDAAGDEVAAPSRAVAFCGIGNPDRFRRDLEAAGVELAGFHPRADHHRHDGAELAALDREAARAGAALVTTEKDLARMPPGLAGTTSVPLLAFRIEAEVHEPQPLVELLRVACAKVAA